MYIGHVSTADAEARVVPGMIDVDIAKYKLKQDPAGNWIHWNYDTTTGAVTVAIDGAIKTSVSKSRMFWILCHSCRERLSRNSSQIRPLKAHTFCWRPRQRFIFCEGNGPLLSRE